jgi:hypothetical protein
MRSLRLSLCLITLLLAGCHTVSGTRMEEVTSRKAVPAALTKVLLVGITTTPQVQAEMEQAFAREFVARKREVLLASRQFPGDRQPLREEVLQKVKAEGATAVLVVRLLNFEVGADAAPESGFALHAPARDPGTRVGWQQDAWLAGAPAGGEARQSRAIVETRLYDTANGEVIWQGRSRTLTRRDRQAELDGFVSAIMRELHRGGWL